MGYSQPRSRNWDGGAAMPSIKSDRWLDMVILFSSGETMPWLRNSGDYRALAPRFSETSRRTGFHGRPKVRPPLTVSSNFELDHTGKQATFSSLQTHSIEVPNGFLQVAVSKTIRPVCVAT